MSTTRARCVIPAAGLGTRMRPVTRFVPKELLPIGTRPMIQWCLTEAIEGGFEEIGVVLSDAKPALEAYLVEGGWREGLLPDLEQRAGAVSVTTFRQEEPVGVVGAVLAAGAWLEDGAVAVLLPDNVRIAGPPPITAVHLADAARRGVVLAACHRVGPESRHFFADVGRIELDELTPAGAGSRVLELQERGGRGAFRAPAEGGWRLLPRYTATEPWVDEARREVREVALTGREADDVAVHRRLVERKLLRALPWNGTVVDAGNPAGYLCAAHLLHEAGSRERDALDQGPTGSPVSIDLGKA